MIFLGLSRICQDDGCERHRILSGAWTRNTMRKLAIGTAWTFVGIGSAAGFAVGASKFAPSLWEQFLGVALWLLPALKLIALLLPQPPADVPVGPEWTASPNYMQAFVVLDVPTPGPKGEVKRTPVMQWPRAKWHEQQIDSTWTIVLWSDGGTDVHGDRARAIREYWDGDTWFLCSGRGEAMRLVGLAATDGFPVYTHLAADEETLRLSSTWPDRDLRPDLGDWSMTFLPDRAPVVVGGVPSDSVAFWHEVFRHVTSCGGPKVIEPIVEGGLVDFRFTRDRPEVAYTGLRFTLTLPVGEVESRPWP